MRYPCTGFPHPPDVFPLVSGNTPGGHRNPPPRPCTTVKGYLAHEKQRPSRILHKDYAYGPTVVLGGGGVFT